VVIGYGSFGRMLTNMSSWHSYPSIFNFGHKAARALLTVPVMAQEKVDGSQFSFGRFEGELKVRSKGQEIVVDAPPKMFQPAVEHVAKLDLRDGWTYRGEVLTKPKHNTLVYERVPIGFVILFDINDGEESFLPYNQVSLEGLRLGLEVVPLLWEGEGSFLTLEVFKILLDTPSILGGQKVEGVVLKPIAYDIFGTDKHVLFAKFVSEGFKEMHQAESYGRPVHLELSHRIALQVGTKARWQKAIQHLREEGKINDAPQDIGPLIKEIQRDVEKECEEDIKLILYREYKDHILRQVYRGFPEWYKQMLLEKQFEAGGIENVNPQVSEAS